DRHPRDRDGVGRDARSRPRDDSDDRLVHPRRTGRLGIPHAVQPRSPRPPRPLRRHARRSRVGLSGTPSSVRGPALLVATVFGVGYVPFAPGTFGSAAGLLVWWALPASPLVHAGVILLLFAAGSWSGSVAERHFGRTDPGQVVIDEVVGVLITLFMN